LTPRVGNFVHPSLIFSSEAGAYPYWSPKRNSTKVSSLVFPQVFWSPVKYVLYYITVTVSYLHFSIILSGKDGAYPSEAPYGIQL